MAKSILLKQLAVEENYYTAISIIEALGKIGDYSCIDSILYWTKEHDENVILQKQFFVLKHIRIALVKLDDNTYGNVKKFDEKYGSYLENYFYL